MSEEDDVEDSPAEDVEGDSFAKGDLKPDDYQTRLKKLATAMARQFFCTCSGLMFPVLASLHELLLTLDAARGHRGMKDASNWFAFKGDIALAGIIGLVTAGILMNLIGRKNTVIVANVSHLAHISYSYLKGSSLDLVFPHWLFLIVQFVSDFSRLAYIFYVAEITSPTNRAFFLGAYSLGYYLLVNSNKATIKSYGINSIFRNYLIATCVTLVVAVLVPESPLWLTLKGLPEKAEETFSWLRAGNTDANEFNQMVDKANTVDRRPVALLHQLGSGTFATGTLYTLYLCMCCIDTCKMTMVFIFRAYPEHSEKPPPEILVPLVKLIIATAFPLPWNAVYGSIIFMCSSFVVPRKVLLFVSLATQTVIPGSVGLNVRPWDLLIRIASYCGIASAIGVTPLSIILPVEYFPMAVRDIGVIVASSFLRILEYFSTAETVVADINIPMLVGTPWLYFSLYYGALIVAPLAIVFMPETKGTHLYQLDELNLRPAFLFGEKGSASESAADEEAAEESE